MRITFTTRTQLKTTVTPPPNPLLLFLHLMSCRTRAKYCGSTCVCVVFHWVMFLSWKVLALSSPNHVPSIFPCDSLQHTITPTCSYYFDHIFPDKWQLISGSLRSQSAPPPYSLSSSMSESTLGLGSVIGGPDSNPAPGHAERERLYCKSSSLTRFSSSIEPNVSSFPLFLRTTRAIQRKLL